MNKLRNFDVVPLKNVNINDEFWSKYVKLVNEVAIPYQWEALNDRIPGADPSHAIKNFRIAAELEKGEFEGIVFKDSDVSKWLEAVSYSLETAPNKEFENIADVVIDIIEKAQEPDGYLDTYFILKSPDKKWTNLAECHELYCAGHFIEAAVAYYKATGKHKVIDIACRLADCINETFGPEEGKIHGYDGHQEIELALVKLYRLTQNEKYLKLSKYFLDERGKEPAFFDIEWEKRGKVDFWPDFRNWGKEYTQTHLPVRKQITAEGHAVRLVYMCIAMADVAIETNDEELFNACKGLWENIVTKRMYITGGIGSTTTGEAFTFDYDLPNDTAYAETCASIGLAFFAYRMLQMEAKGCYGDIMERALYNTIIAGMSLDGKRFFYVNPLEVDPEACEKDAGKYHVKPTRQKWFGCPCCPPNIIRTLASLGQYIYTFNNDAIYTHLYIGGETDIIIGDQKVKLIQETQYPWEEKVIIKVSTEFKKEFTLGFRIPGWCEDAKVSINKEIVSVEAILVEGYALIKREWLDGDVIEIIFEMPVIRMKANPRVRENIGKVALQRGPIVYCLEQEDNGGNLHNIILPREAEFRVVFETDFLGGISVLEAEGRKITTELWGNELYKSNASLDYIPYKLKFIPYYSWANRSVGEMTVWVMEN